GFHRFISLDGRAAARSGDATVKVCLNGGGALALNKAAMRRLVKQLIGGTQVFADFVGFPDDVSQKAEVLVLVGYEVVDRDIARLAVAVHTPIALLEFRWVPGTVKVQQIAG